MGKTRVDFMLNKNGFLWVNAFGDDLWRKDICIFGPPQAVRFELQPLCPSGPPLCMARGGCSINAYSSIVHLRY